jgi:hypothetical protein
MSRPLVAIHDLSTGVSEEREMNDQEYAQHLIDIQHHEEHEAQMIAETEAKATVKAAALAKLLALGLTEEEAQALTK